jgi:ATP-binding cassette subfamily B protein
LSIFSKPLFFPSFRQPDAMDCGPTCLRIISKHYGKSFSLTRLREMSYTNREGSSLSHLAGAAEDLGYRTLGVRISLEQLIEEAPLPAIIHWDQNHFVVAYKLEKGNVYISDPGIGLVTYTDEEFLEHWIGGNATRTTKEGVVLLLEPTPDFFASKDDPRADSKTFSFLFPYVKPYNKYFETLLSYGFDGFPCVYT